MWARVFQHEIDHLDGVLFIDRVKPLKRVLLRSKLKKLEKTVSSA
jgi:peptide deformylase